MGWKSPGILLLALVSLAPGSCNKDSGGTAAEPAPGIVLASEGVPRLNIFVATGEPPGTLLTAAVTDLDQALATIVGAPFQTTVAAAFPASDPGAGIYVGLATDASWVEAPSLDVEDCLLRTTPSGQVLLLGGSERGVAHAVYGFLEKLGCRWYFPGQTWAVIPRRSTLSIAFDERQSPDLAFQRSIWMGHGMHTPEISRDFGDWQRRNRMGGPMPLSTAHSWPGIDPATDFATHPEWFALVNGVRQASKPCYANPEVVARGIQRAISYFEANPSASMISVSAPDGLGYCEDDMCRQLAGVESVYTAYDALYGRRPDGTEVCVTSETIFAYANQVADAVAERFPGKYVGCLAYSAYAHPPSFSLRPNIYIQITTGYRRTPLTLGQQMVAFASKCPNIGIYEYYDVEQWSWEKPGAARAARLDYLQSSIRFFARAGLRSVRGEMSNNWAPNGIGYYALSRLMWDSATDVRTVEEDFYQGAFGPAAEALRRFFRRWESGQGMNPRTLALAHRDLQEATQSTADTPEIHARVDAIRMYLHFLAHYVQPNTSGSVTALVTQYGEEGARQRVDYLGRYVRKLINTHMIHSYAFNRYLKTMGTALGLDTTAWQSADVPPTPEEVETHFQQDLLDVDLAGAKDVSAEIYSRDLVPVGSDATPSIFTTSFRSGAFLIPATAGEEVRMSFVEAGVVPTVFYVSTDDFQGGMTSFVRTPIDGVVPDGTAIRFTASATGYYPIVWNNRTLAEVSHRGVLVGDSSTQLNAATLYFYVPSGTSSFLIRTSAYGGPSVTVQDGSGNVILSVDGRARTGVVSPISSGEYIIDVPAGADGAVWSFTGPYDSNRTASVTLVGVPNYLSFQPAMLLVPREALR